MTSPFKLLLKLLGITSTIEFFLFLQKILTHGNIGCYTLVKSPIVAKLVIMVVSKEASMRVIRNFVLSLSVAVLVTSAFFGLASPRVYAWTHALNHWDSNHNDFYCGTSSSAPCLYWAQPSYTSIAIFAYLDVSLENAPGSYDFTVAITGAFNDWNLQLAWNPYIYRCTCVGDATYDLADLGYGVYGVTLLSHHGPAQWNSRDGFWYAALNDVPVYFNTRITWNNSLNFSSTTADGRKVATHETGHLLGLGHTGHTPAIMRQGGTTYYSVQPDDLSGLQSIYPGYYPGSEQ
jgi:predicted Zn-dependent protease